MKKRLLLLTALCSASAWGGPEQLLQIGELPGQKKPELLQARERNPFTRREAKSTDVVVDRESEENQLRALFKAMPVTGAIRGGGTTKVLLASLILEEGKPLPPLLAEQTEFLTVGRITDRQVEIDFIEKDEHAEPRKILIPIDLRPRVSIAPPFLNAPAGPSPPARPSASDRSAADPRSPAP